MKATKVFVTVPTTHADSLRRAIGIAGGGKIGNYSFCSFSVRGVGRFKPGKGAAPSVGKVGKIEKVKEEKIEFICSPKILKKLCAQLKKPILMRSPL